jgi:hypothetical protein
MPDVRDFLRRGYSLFTAIGVGNYSAASGVITGLLFGSKTFDWASIASGAQATTTVTVTGAALGDFVLGVAMSIDSLGLTFRGIVTAANTVTVTANNLTGGAVDLGSGTLSVLVAKASLSV